MTTIEFSDRTVSPEIRLAVSDPEAIGPDGITPDSELWERAQEVAAHNAQTLDRYRGLPWDHPVGRVMWVHVDKVQANQYNPNSVAGQEMKLLHTSVAEDGYCVEASTPVLRADLRWVPVGSLVVGDRIVAFDEERAGDGDGSNSAHGRKFRTAVVTANRLDTAELVRVTTSVGTVLTTPDHPWLCSTEQGDASERTLRWTTSADLLPGKSFVRFLTQPWEEDRTWEAGWLSGFLDGEGCVSKSASGRQTTYRLYGSQKPSVTADLMVTTMRKYGDPKVKILDRSRFKNQQNNVQCGFNRIADIMRVLGSVRPQRLLDNAGEFWEGTSLMKTFTRVEVLSVEKVGLGEIARLSTSTGTFIGAGFAMHNTMPIVTMWDSLLGKAVIVDGFHRYTTMVRYSDIYETTGGYLPVVMIDKPIEDRIASTVRHNRARGKHSTTGMGSLVFQMLEAGDDDATICNKLGLEAEELARLKHITGYSKLYANMTYSPVILAKPQMVERAKYKKEHPDEYIPNF